MGKECSLWTILRRDFDLVETFVKIEYGEIIRRSQESQDIVDAIDWIYIRDSIVRKGEGALKRPS
jgi:hypothetical protein